jgi:hypothetical protein
MHFDKVLRSDRPHVVSHSVRGEHDFAELISRLQVVVIQSVESTTLPN